MFKKNKEGLAGRFKILGQVGLGIIIGLTMYYNNHVVISREIKDGRSGVYSAAEKLEAGQSVRKDENGKEQVYVNVRTATTTIPFIKTHEFRYEKIAAIFGKQYVGITTPVIYIIFVIFIIVAVSNGANITDGVDGLATGVSAIIGVCLGCLLMYPVTIFLRAISTSWIFLTSASCPYS